MKAESTIQRERQRLRALLDAGTLTDAARNEAYGAETALTWTLHNCSWTPSGQVRDVTDRLARQGRL